MLAHTSKWIVHHSQAASASLSALCRKPLATLMIILVLATVLTIPLLFWIFSNNLKQVAHSWPQTGRIALYLHPALSTSDIEAFFNQLKSRAEIGSISLISASQGLTELQKQEGMQDILHYLPENPLPAVIDIVPALALNTPDKIDQFFSELRAYPQVEQAKLDRQWVNKLYALLSFTRKIAHVVMSFLTLAVIFIISTTLRLAIQKHHDEIKVLKLIGATDSFIARPFLYSGIWYSMGGVLLAIILINFFLLFLAISGKELLLAYHISFPFIGLSTKHICIIIMEAVLLGWLGANFSVKRHLVAIEPS